MKIRIDQPLAAVGLIQAACLDGTDIPAWSSRDPHDTRKGLGDPDARVGRCKSGAFDLGYLSLMMADIEGFCLGHVEASLIVNEKKLVMPLLERVLGDDIAHVQSINIIIYNIKPLITQMRLLYA